MSYSRYRGAWTALGVGVVLAAAAHGASKPVHAHTTAASIPVPASSGRYSPASWAHSLLTAAKLPVTGCNLGAIEAWESAEGGAWENGATANPLDTTMPEPGSQPVNSVGVQSYRSWREGLDATVATLRNGDYPAILSALGNGGSAQRVADAVASSPWGTSAFEASC